MEEKYRENENNMAKLNQALIDAQKEQAQVIEKHNENMKNMQDGWNKMRQEDKAGIVTIRLQLNQF